jgi:hypothetical protein
MRWKAKAIAALRVIWITLEGEGMASGADGVSDFDRSALVRRGLRETFM